jgi:hypothetical protein
MGPCQPNFVPFFSPLLSEPWRPTPVGACSNFLFSKGEACSVSGDDPACFSSSRACRRRSSRFMRLAFFLSASIPVCCCAVCMHLIVFGFQNNNCPSIRVVVCVCVCVCVFVCVCVCVCGVCTVQRHMPHDGMGGVVLRVCMVRDTTQMHSADAHACLYCSSARCYRGHSLNKRHISPLDACMRQLLAQSRTRLHASHRPTGTRIHA